MAGEKLLLVEGTDDEHVVRHLCRHHGLEDAFEIKDCGGFDQLRKDFPVRLKASEINAIGVLVDANTNIQARWDSLRNHLVSAGYNSVPRLPVREGFAAEPPPDTLLPRVGIWLMPDNSANGALEDFLSLLVPMSDPLLDHARVSIDGIPAEHRLFKDRDAKKALIHTWLAWQQEPGRPYGTAIKAGYLDAGEPKIADFVKWLRKLFT